MDATGLIALAMAIAIGLSAIGSGIGQGIATGRATESMARQPEMAGGIRTTLILGLAFAVFSALIEESVTLSQIRNAAGKRGARRTYKWMQLD